MKIIVGCEFSGVIRSAFSALGHDAWSVDLLPTEQPGQHLQCDVLTVLDQGWDLAIFNPPCTYLCNSGVRWLVPGGKLDKARHKLMQEACDFFAALYHAPIARVCVENPVMHKYARDYLQSAWRVPAHSMTCQPYEHGHAETKRHCFWLRGLPLLLPSNIVPPDFLNHPIMAQHRRITGEKVQQRGSGYRARVHYASPGPNRWKERSRTLPGIAAAMAQQWGAL